MTIQAKARLSASTNECDYNTGQEAACTEEEQDDSDG